MSWLAPIGFLGLLGIVALVIIYVIRPNYQNKYISSTFVWRLSLGYRKKTVPISKIQSILTFLAQALILAILGTMLAGPSLASAGATDENEAVIIVDASAGMRISDTKSNTTRFSRALTEAKKKAQDTFDKGSRVSFILANDTPEFVFRGVGADEGADAIGKINVLIEGGEDGCSWSSADVDGAVALAETVLESNPDAKIYLYTGTSYTYHSGVNVIKIGAQSEWNATILDCKAELNNDNHYEITVDTALYGKTDFLTVTCKVYGANGDPANTITLEKGEFFDPLAEEKEIVFTSDDMPNGALYSYDYIEAYVSVADSLPGDNYFFLYGGARPVIKVQYASSSPNNFFESAIRSLRQNKRQIWDIRFDSLKEGEAYATEGYDLYIFEHRMPDVIPTDGVVLLVDPTTAPDGSGLQIGSAYEVESNSILSPGISHTLTKYTDPTRITIAKYNDIILSEDYSELAFYNGRPVMLVKETDKAKIVVWAFDLNYSNLIALPDFAFLTYNLFNYFIPETFTSHCFEKGDTVKLTARGENLKLTDSDGIEHSYDSGAGEITLTTPGTYTATQTAMNGTDVISESFFVKIPSSESNPSKTVEALQSVEIVDSRDTGYLDLLVYLAIALVLLLFAEWVLEIKKNY